MSPRPTPPPPELGGPEWSEMDAPLTWGERAVAIVSVLIIGGLIWVAI